MGAGSPADCRSGQVGRAMPDVHQPAVVVLGVPVDPELVQLVLPLVAEQPEARTRQSDPAVVLPQAGPAGAERILLLALSELLQSCRPPGLWQPVEVPEF